MLARQLPAQKPVSNGICSSSLKQRGAMNQTLNSPWLVVGFEGAHFAP
jgi:hypothetical protein